MSGALGLSPDTLTTLGQYLSQIGVAANSRTAGGFLQAPTLGAAMSYAGAQLPQFQMQVQESRARQALEAAQTGQTQAQTELTRLQIPFVQAWNQARVNYLNGGGNGAAGGPQMAELPGGGAPPATPSSISGAAVIDPSARPGLLTWATQGTSVPPALLGSFVQKESGWDPTAVNSTSGAAGLAGILPSTAQKPGYGVPSLDPSALQDPRNNLRFAAHYIDGIGKKFGLNSSSDWLDPANRAKVATVINAYGGYGANSGPTQYAADVMAGMNTPVPAGPMTGVAAPSVPLQPGTGQKQSFVPPGLPTPQQAFMDAQIALAQANQAAQGAMLGFPGQDIAAQNYRLRAEQDLNYAYGSLKPQTFRPGGGGWSPAYGPMGMTQPTTVQLPGGQEQAAVQMPGFAVGGQFVTNPSITPLTYGAVGGGGLTAKGNPANSYVARPVGGPAASSAAAVAPAPDAGGYPEVQGAPPGAPVLKSIGPQQESFLKTRGEKLGDTFAQVDEDADVAVQQNFMLDNMRTSSAYLKTGKFADMKNDLLAYFNGAAQTVGLPQINPDQVANYQALTKNGMQILFKGVRQVSSKMAAQEVQMMEEAYPNAEMSRDGFGMVLDEMQGLNDFQIARQQFKQSYQGDPQNFSVAVNKFMTPAAFMLNRMTQTPDGQRRFAELFANLAKTAPGQAMAKQLMGEFNNVLRAGYFGDLAQKYGTAPPFPTQQTAAAAVDTVIPQTGP